MGLCSELRKVYASSGGVRDVMWVQLSTTASIGGAEWGYYIEQDAYHVCILTPEKGPYHGRLFRFASFKRGLDATWLLNYIKRHVKLVDATKNVASRAHAAQLVDEYRYLLYGAMYQTPPPRADDRPSARVIAVPWNSQDNFTLEDLAAAKFGTHNAVRQCLWHKKNWTIHKSIERSDYVLSFGGYKTVSSPDISTLKSVAMSIHNQAGRDAADIYCYIHPLMNFHGITQEQKRVTDYIAPLVEKAVNNYTNIYY